MNMINSSQQTASYPETAFDESRAAGGTGKPTEMPGGNEDGLFTFALEKSRALFNGRVTTNTSGAIKQAVVDVDIQSSDAEVEKVPTAGTHPAKPNPRETPEEKIPSKTLKGLSDNLPAERLSLVAASSARIQAPQTAFPATMKPLSDMPLPDEIESNVFNRKTSMNGRSGIPPVSVHPDISRVKPTGAQKPPDSPFQFDLISPQPLRKPSETGSTIPVKIIDISTSDLGNNQIDNRIHQSPERINSKNNSPEAHHKSVSEKGDPSSGLTTLKNVIPHIKPDLRHMESKVSKTFPEVKPEQTKPAAASVEKTGRSNNSGSKADTAVIESVNPRQSSGESIKVATAAAGPDTGIPKTASYFSTSSDGAHRLGANSLEQPVIQQIVRQASMQLTGDKSEVVIRLHPEHLGKIHLKIAMDQQLVLVKLTAEIPLVREIVEANLHLLRDELAQHGLSIDRFDVMGNPGRRHHPGNDRTPDSGAGNKRRKQEKDRPEMFAAPAGSLRTETGRLDFFA